MLLASPEGHYCYADDPGCVVLADYKEPEDEEDSDLRRGRVPRVLQDLRYKDITHDEEDRGIPEVRLVQINCIPNISEFVPKAKSPYVSTAILTCSTACANFTVRQ